MMQDVVETRDTIKDVLINEEKLSMLCLQDCDPSSSASTSRKEESIKEAALLLQSYERQISTIEGALKVRF